MTTIINAAPMTKLLGTQDLSTRALVPEAEVLPTHLPKVYIYAQKGPTTPELVVGDSRTAMFGTDTFDLRSPYATHATVLSNLVNAQGNAQMIERIKPDDAGPDASIRLYLDVLPAQIPEYARNSDGSFQLDVDGQKIATATTVAGYKIKWVAKQVTNDVSGVDGFGVGTQKAGDQTNQATSQQSIRYPIMDLKAPYFGKDGNNYGIRVWAPSTTSGIPIDERIVNNEKVYPFRISCVYRKNELSTPNIVETQTGEQYLDICLKPDTVDRNTDALLYIGDRFIQAYQDLDTPGMPKSYGPFGELHVYENNLRTVLGLLYNVELPVRDQFSDIQGTAGVDERYMINPVSGASSKNVPYHAIEMVTTGEFVRLSENSTVYAAGGSDGTMDEALFATLVANRVSEYANENSVLQDTAKYPESIIYDSGFPLETKKALLSFLAIRKDTFVVLATHDVLGQPLTASQENSLAIALKTRAQNYPESDYYGTAVMRAMIVGRSGKLLNSQYTKHLPLSLEVASKAATYMGAGNGIWKGGFAFDVSPLNRVSMFSHINVTYTPSKTRNKDWDVGLNWVQQFERNSYFFPAFKTVYDKDTSVLNSFFTAMACVELEKVGERAWRTFTGRSNLTNDQLKERVNEFVRNAVKDRFDGRFVIEPETYFTEADLARGYSWSLRIKIYAPNMKTVMTLSLEARRLDDLQQ